MAGSMRNAISNKVCLQVRVVTGIALIITHNVINRGWMGGPSAGANYESLPVQINEVYGSS